LNTHLIFFSKEHKILVSILLFLFFLLVALNIHGYSISAWREYIDGDNSKCDEILCGTFRSARSDDFVAEIPLMLSQLSHKPSFPVINQNIGQGYNALYFPSMPAKHILTVFKPTIWGFFIGPDKGLSWRWWSLYLGLFYVYFLVFMLISRNQFYLSVMGSLFLLFSPFFQFWSMHIAEVPLFMGLMFVAFIHVCFSSKKKIILLHSLLLGWSVGCFVLNFTYPPYQISLFYLFLFMTSSFIISRYKEFKFSENKLFRFTGFLIAVVIAGGAFFIYYDELKDILQTIAATEYPGKRFSIGGEYHFGRLFSNNFFILFALKYIFSSTEMSFIGDNICEAGSFLFFFPFVVLFLVWQLIVKRKSIDKFSVILLGYFALILFYMFLGFPKFLSKYSLFGFMPDYRAVIGLGIADIILLVSFLSTEQTTEKTKEKFIIPCLWMVFLFICGICLQRHVKIPFVYIIIVVLLNGVLSFYLLASGKKKIAFAFLVLISFITTIWFNPVVRGGTAYLYRNPLSKKILEIEQKEQGHTKWATFSNSTIYGNLFRILGVKAIDGLHPYPQFSLWKTFDRNKQGYLYYNRYAHISFAPISEDRITFDVPLHDNIIVYIQPFSEVFNLLGVTHFLVTGKDLKIFEEQEKFEEVYSYKNFTIYKTRSYVDLGDLYKEQKKYAKALFAYRKAIELRPNDVLGHNKLAILYSLVQKYDEAASEFQKAIELTPRNVYLYHNLAKLYKTQRKYKKAIEVYKKIIELEPNSAKVYNILGVLCSIVKQYDEAVHFYNKALEINPDDANIYYNVAKLYDIQGQQQKALENYRNSLRLNPNDVKVKKRIEELEGTLKER